MSASVVHLGQCQLLSRYLAGIVDYWNTALLKDRNISGLTRVRKFSVYKSGVVGKSDGVQIS